MQFYLPYIIQKLLDCHEKVNNDIDRNVLTIMGIGLTQQETRCSNGAKEPGEKLLRVESTVEAEAELVQIGLIVAAASMVGAEHKCFEVTDCHMDPLLGAKFSSITFLQGNG